MIDFTSEFLEFYIWGLLASVNWILAWQATTLKVKFLKIWLFIRRKKKMVFTPTDFEEYTYENWGILGELLNCTICFSHWVGAVFTGLLCYFFEAPVHLIPIAFFTYPALIYFSTKKYIS